MPCSESSPFPVPTRFLVRRTAFVALCSFLALLLPLLLFLPSLRFNFIALDDSSYVLYNPVVATGLSWQNVRDAFSFPGPAPMWLPVLWLSYMADVTLLGGGPGVAGPFHAVNVVLHALDTLLLFALFLRLSRRPSASLLLALLWAVHPLRVESVAWVAERKDVLSLLFLLGSLHAWIAFLRAVRPVPRAAAWTGAIIGFALGLLVKPSIVPLPILFAALALPPCSDRLLGLPAPPPSPHPFRKTALRLLAMLWPFLLLALTASRASVLTSKAANDVIPVSFVSRIFTIPSVAAFYLSKTLLPVRLSLIYPSWTSALLPGLLGLVLLSAAAIALFRIRRRAPFLWLGGLFAALFFAPVSGIVQVPFNLVADRFSYLPAIGLSLALLQFFVPREGRRPARGNSPPALASPPRRRFPRLCIVHCALCILLVAFAVASARHLPAWKNTRSIYGTVRRLQPDHYSVRLYDAQEAFRRGRFDEARRAIDHAAAAAGRMETALVAANAPIVAAQSGDRAFLDYLLAFPVPPSENAYHSHWCFDVALAHLSLGHYRETLAIADDALPRAAPSDPNRRRLEELAMIAAHALGDAPSAAARARHLGILAPGETSLDLSHFANFYSFLWVNGYRNPAADYFRALVRDFPVSDAFNSIAWFSAVAFWSPVAPEEALSWARRALELEPRDSPRRPGILDTLAAALANAGRFDEAVSTLSSALDAIPAGHPARPAMERRLSLYRRHLPYREIQSRPVPEAEYDYVFDLSEPRP